MKYISKRFNLHFWLLFVIHFLLGTNVFSQPANDPDELSRAHALYWKITDNKIHILKKMFDLNIMSLSGQRLVYRAKAQPLNEINISTFTTGIYVISFRNENGYQVQKFYKQ